MIRARRNDCTSGTSPPPFGVHHEHGRPHAMVIPGSRMGSLSGMAPAGSPLRTSSNGGGGGRGNGCLCSGRVRARTFLFFPFSSCFVKLMNDHKTSEYSLPTPDSHAHHHQYTPFVLSASHRHLPPLHPSLPHSHHAHSHLLPKGCQIDGAAFLPFLTFLKIKLSKSSSPAVPCFSSFRSMRTHGGQGGHNAPQQTRATSSRRQTSPTGKRETTKEGEP